MKLHLRNIANSPHIVFVISWSLCLFLYSLGGAGILPKLSTDLFIFIVSFLLLFVVTSFFLKKINFLRTPPLKPVNINYKLLLLVNSILFLPNFIYSGIPILNGVRDDTFGIPGIMIFATSLNCFTCLCCYYLYLYTHKKKFLLYITYCLLLFGIMVSRGGMMETGVSMFFLWMYIKSPVLTLKKLLIIVTGVLLVFYLFGVAGNYRTISALASAENPIDPDYSKIDYSSDVILNLGNASDVFVKNIIPGEFFWSYLYLTSPLSNLQYNINITRPPLTLDNFYLVVVNETMWDFLSKRIDGLHKGYARKMPILLIDGLTVSTTLAGSYATAGWWGMFYVMMFYWVFPVLYLLMIGRNPLAVIGISVLCTIYVLSSFDNMFVLSGLSLQIFYPIIIMLFQNIRFKQDAPSGSGPVTTA